MYESLIERMDDKRNGRQSGTITQDDRKKEIGDLLRRRTAQRKAEAEAPKTERQRMEDELAELRKSYAEYDQPEMQGIADNRSWEEIYAESEKRNELNQRIKMLESQLRTNDAEDYYQGVLERMGQLDEETVGYLDQLNAGMPQETGPEMQGIADNRSWEERYAEEQAWEDFIMGQLKEKGYDAEAVAQMRDDRTRQVNRETYEAEVAKSQQEAEENGFWASVKSVPQNLTGGLGTLSLAAQNAHRTLTGDDTPVDYYTPEMIGQAKAQAARETVSRRLEENTELSTGLTGNVASFLYNTGMSMADSAAVALLGNWIGGAAAGGAAGVSGVTANAAKIGAQVGSTLLGGTAATQAAREAKERGVSDEQALLTGLTAGAAEMIFEKLSLGNLLDSKPAKGVLQERVLGVLREAGVQGAIEGSEEVATSIANSITDAIINGDASAYSASIYDYMAQGMEYGEAVQAATKDWAISLAQDFAGGFLSGGVTGGVKTGTQTALETSAAGRKMRGTEQAMVTELRELQAGDQLAQRVQRLLDERKPGEADPVTNAMRVDLQERINKAKNRQIENEQVETVSRRLRELGEEGDVEKIARAAIQAAGMEENRVERFIGPGRTLSKSTYGEQVARELRSGEQWAKAMPEKITLAQGMRETQEKTVNPKATDEREVTGYRFNEETGELDALVRKEDGGTEAVPMKKAKVTMRQMALAKHARQYGEDGATMMHAILPGQDVDTFARQWYLAYSYGEGGLAKNRALESRFLYGLRDGQAAEAWEMGNKARQQKTAQNAKERARRASKPRAKGKVSLRGATIDGVKYAAVKMAGLTEKQRRSIQYMWALARETGIDVVFYESTVNKQGQRTGANGVYKDGVIYLDIAAGADTLDTAQAAVLRTAGHELTHFIQDMDEDAYNTVKDFVLAKLCEKEGVDLEQLIARQMAKNKGLSPAEALDEVVADACEMMLRDSTVLEKLAREDRSLAEKIVQFLRDLMRRLQKAFEGVEAKSAEAKAMADYTKELQQIWDDALRRAVDAGGTTKNTAEDGGGKYQIREEFASEIDAWDKAGRPEGEQFVLGSTGPVLQGLGAIESDIYVTGDKIKTILQDHPEMTLDEIKKVPQILEDPVLVLKSRNVGRGKQANTRMVVFGNVKAKNGKPVFAVLDLRPVENGFAVEGMQKVNSAYTKSTEPVQFVRESYVLHADKKRTVPLLRSIGFQMPIELLRDGSVGSISYRQRSVNLYGEPFSSVVKEKTGKMSARDSEITDREILASTLESAAQSELEKTLLERYRRYAAELSGLERDLEYQRELLRHSEAGEKVNDRLLSAKEITNARNRAASYARQIDQKNKLLRNLEKRKELQEVLARERAYIEEVLNGDMEARKARYEPSLERKLAEEWGKARSWQRRYEAAIERNPQGERAARRARTAEVKKQIEKSAKRLLDLLVTNTDKKHVPEDLKEPLRELLLALDLSSTRLLRGGPATKKDRDYSIKLQLVKEALDARVQKETGGETIGEYLDLPAEFAERLQDHIAEARKVMEQLGEGETVVNRLSLSQLEELNMILSVLKRSIETVNELMANRRFAQVENAAKADMAHLRELGGGGGGKTEAFLSWTQMLPVYAFRKIGKGAQSIFESLQDGWDKLARNAKTVMDFTETTYTAKEAKAWSEEVHEVELYDPGEGEYVTVYLTTAQIMSLHALSKREQAYGHMVGEADRPGMGIRPEDITLPKTLKNPMGKTIRQAKHFRMTAGDLARVLALLTDRQVEVADKLQAFMEKQGSKWGNEVSMTRHGYNFFGEKNYFPIETDRQDRPERSVEQGSESDMYRLLNMSSTKSLTKMARNAIMVRNIFDVYSNHMADMAKYNALALPLLDAIKWYNWAQNPSGVGSAIEGAGDTTLKRQITQTYGQAANDYVVQFIRDMNGVKEGGGRGEDLPKRMISNYKRASVAANLRVAFLQPTSYVRAGAVIDPKYLVGAVKEKTAIKDAAAEMKEHSGIALWKSMGFFDTDVGRSMREQIRGTQSEMDKLIDKSMKLAEKGDEITWAMLWKACKLEQRAKGLTGDALIQATSERFREVVYATQVVDSTMTRSGLMRSTTTFNKMATSFMSEPTVSYNMVMQAVDAVREDMRKGKGMNLRMAIKKNAKLIRIVFTTYAASAAASALIEALLDAWRDDDDETYPEKVLEALGGWDGNLIGNLNPLNKVPYVKDVVSLIEGYDAGRMDTQGIATAWKSVQQLWETFAVWSGVQEKPTKVTNYGNTTPYGLIYQAFKGVSQLSGIPLSSALREVQAAWNNTVGAVWSGLRVKTYENEDETSANRLYEAMVEGNRTAWDRESEKWQKREMAGGAAQREAVSAVRSGVKSKLRDDYYTGSVDANAAERYMTVWLGMNADEAESQRLEWDCYVETGIKYSDIRTLYERGELERSEVIGLRMKYGQDTEDEAESKAAWYDWGKEHPRYSDLSEKKAGGWYDYVKSSGLSAERYYQIAMEAAEQGVNSKDELVAFIRKQGVSSAQQRALWNALKNSSWKNTGTPWA